MFTSLVLKTREQFFLILLNSVYTSHDRVKCIPKYFKTCDVVFFKICGRVALDCLGELETK